MVWVAISLLRDLPDPGTKIMIAAQCAIALCLKNVHSGSAVKESACRVGVLSLGREVALEKEMATHSSIIVWGMP